MKRIILTIAAFFLLAACQAPSHGSAGAAAAAKEYVGIVSTLEHETDPARLADLYERLYALVYPSFGQGEQDDMARKETARQAAQQAETEAKESQASIELAVVDYKEMDQADARKRLEVFLDSLSMDVEDVAEAYMVRVQGKACTGEACREVDETVLAYRIGEAWHIYD